MITPRENYLIATYGGKPQWVPDKWEDCTMISFCKYSRHTDDDGIEWDNFGVSYSNSFPTEPKFWDCVADWKNYQFPDIDSLDWEAEAEELLKVTDPNKANIVQVGDNGFFLTLANAMGFTNALVALLEEEDDCLELFRAITDYTKKSIDYAVKYLHPDVIHWCEDTANSFGPFMSRETYQKLFKPFTKELADYAHANNCAFNIHNCGDPGYLFEEYLDMGVNVANACIDSEALETYRKNFGRDLCIEGGWGNKGPWGQPDAPEDVVKQSMVDCFAKYADMGGFIAHMNAMVTIGDQKKVKQKVEWLQEASNGIRFEYYNKKTPEELERLSVFTGGLAPMFELMGITDD